MQSDPDTSPTASRRRLLRSVAGLAAVGALAGCNEGGDGTESSPAPDGSDTPASTPTPSPTLVPTTAPPTDPPTATPTPTPSPTATATATPTDSAVAREFVAHLRAGEFDAAHAMFTPDLASVVTRPTLERYWLGLQAQHGAVEAVGSVGTTTREGSEVALVPVECAQGSAGIEVAGASGGRIGGLWFSGEYSAPDYVDDAAFTERTLTLEPEGCSLPATLTVPADASGGSGTATAAGSGVPGVVLVHGSGPHDRDETIGPNKPFRDIAQGLATRGVAVLRYEKRTYACDVPRAEWAIDDIVVDDAVHALGVLRDQPEVDPERSAVAGHSLGAACVPRIAERDGRVAGGAVLSGNARPFTAVYPEQVRHIFEVQGGLSAREEQQLAAVTQLMSAVKDGTVADGRPIGPLPGIWWKTFYEYDQVATANRIDADLMFAHGGRDFQIPIDPAMSGWREGLDDADATRFERYPDCSHLFQPGTEPSLTQEYVFADNVARDLVADLADWTNGL